MLGRKSSWIIRMGNVLEKEKSTLYKVNWREEKGRERERRKGRSGNELYKIKWSIVPGISQYCFFLFIFWLIYVFLSVVLSLVLARWICLSLKNFIFFKFLTIILQIVSFKSVFRIRFILIWIRILGSVSWNNGSGSESCSKSDLKSGKYQRLFYFFFL